jgi:hypothetical protein
MKLVRYTDPALFKEQVEPFLCQHEAEHNLLLGLTSGLASGRLGADEAYLVTIVDADQIVALALRTAPERDLILSIDMPAEALHLIVQDMAEVDTQLEGINGDIATAHAFAQAWQDKTGRAYDLKMAMRIYRLKQVIPPRPVSGYMRPSRPDELVLATDWMHAFAEEAVEAVPHEESERLAMRYLEQDSAAIGLRFWEDNGQVVSQAGYSGPTPHGIRVNAVYTPPALRGRGYASAVVAALSQELLDMGRQFCFLFTDLANPTSNHIYQQIGYNAVSDVHNYRFVERG